MRCPNCGGNNAHVMQETATSGKDVSFCNGLLGFLCLGPIGILCAFLGGNKQTFTRSYIVCSDCNTKSNF